MGQGDGHGEGKATKVEAVSGVAAPRDPQRQ